MKYCIIGAGVIGNAIAREISNRKLGEVIVLEKESESAIHASGRNSGVIHSGINQKPGTKKAELCLEGSKMLRDYCQEKKISMEECGTLVVALTEKERAKLKLMQEMALQIGVPGVRIISGEELREREPSANGLEALLSPTGAIVDARAVVKSLQKDAESNGAEYKFNTQVTDINRRTIITSNGEITADFIINCAGLHADKIAHMAGAGREYSMLPFRGEYVKIPAHIESMIYQVPDMRFPFLGVHLTKHIDGSVLAGPTATLSFGGREDYEKSQGLQGVPEFLRQKGFIKWAARTALTPASLKQLIYNLRLSNSREVLANEIDKIYDGHINPEDMEAHPAGIRAQLISSDGRLVNDFHIETMPGSVHILNAVSPGFTASLAFANYIAANYIK